MRGKALLRKLLRVQLIRYWLSGVGAIFIDWSIFFILAVVFSMHYNIALAIAVSIGGVFNYIFNKYFTFFCRSKKIKTQVGTFFIINLAYMFISIFILSAYIEVLSMKPFNARMLTSITTFLIGYVMHKRVTFNKDIFTQK